MSCSRRLVLLAALAAPLGACGFRPLHQRAGGADARVLRGVEVARIPERLGQQLRNELELRFLPGAEPRHSLRVGVRSQTGDLAIQEDETAVLARVTVTAEFSLLDLAANQEVVKGRSQVVVSYTRTTSQYANLVAEEDGRRRALREIADDIRQRVALFLVGRS